MLKLCFTSSDGAQVHLDYESIYTYSVPRQGLPAVIGAVMSIPRLALVATASLALSGVAAAACPALPAPVIAPGDGILSVEGPVSAIDLVDRTVTVVGTCINIPATMLIDTSFDGIGDITLDQLVTGGATSPIGGTMIIDADVTTDVAGNVVYTATNPYFDFGENVVVGPLISVDPLTSSFVVGHSTIIMLSLIHISSPRDTERSRMPSSA